MNVQDMVTASPFDAWSSAGVLTRMEETREGAEEEERRKRRR